MNTHKMTQITITVTCLALAGCASTGAATPTGTQPPQPPIIETAVIAPTETLTAAATSATTNVPLPTQAPDQSTQVEPLTPENTPVPTATNYPAPAVPLSPTGPWLVFKGGYHDPAQYYDIQYLWAMNQDGTGLTRLTNECVFDFAVQPTSTVQGGLAIAYSTSLDGKCERQYPENPPGVLKILYWPDGNVRTIVYNLSHEAEWLVWSPSGGKLAFTGAMGDTGTNVFIYDPTTEESTRITFTDADDWHLRWSDDERYVLFETYYWGGPMAGYNVPNGVWSARADAGGVTQLVGGIEVYWYLSDIKYLGWASPTDIILAFPQWNRGESIDNRDIRILNIETGDYTTLVSRESLLDVAYSPEHNLFLMTKEATPAPNRLLVFLQNGERREVAGYTIKYVEWLSAYDVFLGQTPDGRAFLVAPDGAVTEIPVPEWSTYDSQSINSHSVIVSPDHQWWAWYHSRRAGGEVRDSELWVGSPMTQPLVPLSSSSGTRPADGLIHAGDVIWSPDSQHLLWLSGAQALWVASPPNFEAVRVLSFPGNHYVTFSDAVWVQ